MSSQVFPFLIAGQSRKSDAELAVHYPVDDRIVGISYRPTASDVEDALHAADQSFKELRSWPTYRRYDVLMKTASLLGQRKAEIARTITLEGARAIKEAEVEVERAILTFESAAEETRRGDGDLIRMDLQPGSEGRIAILDRFPVGPVLAITPFNRPLNLVAHKVAPAIAVGNPIILRPASQTPLTSLLLGDILLEAGFLPSALSIVPCSTKLAESMVQDSRVRMVSFTGSDEVGWHLHRLAGPKRVTLELGGNAGVIVHEDADLEWAAKRITYGAYYYAGQACISVQRIIAHESVYDRLLTSLKDSVSSLRLGDPLLQGVDLGPMINESSARKTESWVQQAVDTGAVVVTGGKRDGQFFEPTLLSNVDRSMKVVCEEIFAPVASISRYAEFDDALAALNDSRYGLQAGLFTHDLKRILHAYRTLEVGGLIVNDISAYRMDHMPYGGVKDSGIGREGPRYAMREMTEERLLVLNP